MKRNNPLFSSFTDTEKEINRHYFKGDLICNFHFYMVFEH